jgi:hypothetical protein
LSTCPVTNSEFDLTYSLQTLGALAFRRPNNKRSYSAMLFVHMLKSSLTAYFSLTLEGATNTAEAPAPFSHYAPSHAMCHMTLVAGCSWPGDEGVQSAMNSASTWDLIALREVKLIIYSASSAAYFPFLLEASLFSNMSWMGVMSALWFCGFESNTKASLLPLPLHMPFSPSQNIKAWTYWGLRTQNILGPIFAPLRLWVPLLALRWLPLLTKQYAITAQPLELG